MRRARLVSDSGDVRVGREQRDQRTMTTANELRAGLMAVAKRSVSIMSGCSNEQSTKLYLVLPMLGLLGYDYTNPFEVFPEHAAQMPDGTPATASFAILKDGAPVIALTCRSVGSDPSQGWPALSRYFANQRSVKLAVLTNGIVYSFYVDSDEPDRLDSEPFMTLDLETVSRVGVADDVLEGLLRITKPHFDPETIAEIAHLEIVKKRLLTVFVEEAKGPTEEFCRFALARVGLHHVRKAAIERYYAPMVKAAFEESLVLPVVQRLRAAPSMDSKAAPYPPLHQVGQRIASSERELALIGYVRRRLAYLVDDETKFEAIENVHYRDYVGRLVIYFEHERKGRLFDFIASSDGHDKYIFPDPIGEIVTNNVQDIDEALRSIFITRVRELSAPSAAPTPTQRHARSA